MSPAAQITTASSPPLQPTGSCLNCRNKKLKCSREAKGCRSCVKAGIACVYAATQPRTGRKRGPYRKRRESLSTTVAGQLETEPPAAGEGTQQQHASLPSHPVESMRGQDVGLVASRNGHPPPDQILELWVTYVNQVDPMTKIIHCPSVGGLIASNCHVPKDLDPGIEVLMFCVYFAAVSSIPAAEVQRRFGEVKSELLARYKTIIERFFSRASIALDQDLRTLQALVLYLICTRRRDINSNLWSLYSLAVRLTQLMGVPTTEAAPTCSPYELEMRRRIWWSLRWMETNYAEDFLSSSPSVFTRTTCPLPANLNDHDLDPSATVASKPRIGHTDITFCLMRWEFRRFFAQMSIPTHEQPETFESFKRRMQEDYLAQRDETRPIDALILNMSRVLLLKGHLATQSASLTPTSSFAASLDIVRLTFEAQTEPHIHYWNWFYQNDVQWHALTRLVADLCQGQNLALDPQLRQQAWQLIARIMERMQERRAADDPARRHIAALVERAQQAQAAGFQSVGAGMEGQVGERAQIDGGVFDMEGVPDDAVLEGIDWEEMAAAFLDSDIDFAFSGCF